MPTLIDLTPNSSLSINTAFACYYEFGGFVFVSIKFDNNRTAVNSNTLIYSGLPIPFASNNLRILGSKYVGTTHSTCKFHIEGATGNLYLDDNLNTSLNYCYLCYFYKKAVST